MFWASFFVTFSTISQGMVYGSWWKIKAYLVGLMSMSVCNLVQLEWNVRDCLDLAAVYALLSTIEVIKYIRSNREIVWFISTSIWNTELLPPCSLTTQLSYTVSCYQTICDYDPVLTVGVPTWIHAVWCGCWMTRSGQKSNVAQLCTQTGNILFFLITWLQSESE